MCKVGNRFASTCCYACDEDVNDGRRLRHVNYTHNRYKVACNIEKCALDESHFRPFLRKLVGFLRI